MRINIENVIMRGDLQITYSGRSLKITVSEICKKLGLTDKDGFRYTVLRNGIVILEPIRDYKKYIEQNKQAVITRTERAKRKRFEEADFFL